MLYFALATQHIHGRSLGYGEPNRAAGRLLVGLAAALVLSAAPAQAVVTSADSCAPTLRGAGDMRWDLTDAGAIADGGHYASSSSSTLDRENAYDIYGTLGISKDQGRTYEQYAASADSCTTADGGRQVEYPARSMHGLSVTREVYVPETGLGYARLISTLTNNGSAPVNVTVRFFGDLGADDFTALDSSATGDMLVDAADDWAATYDRIGGAGPALAHVWDERGALDAADQVEFTDSDELTVLYRDVKVAPGDSVTYMFLAGQRMNEGDARSAAGLMATEPAEVLDGLTAAERAQVRNWCTGDCDRDGVADAGDDCRSIADADQSDVDGDGRGDACDDDIDGDGLSNATEDALGTDRRRGDTDGDGVGDGSDACPLRAGSRSDGCPAATAATAAATTKVQTIRGKARAFRVRATPSGDRRFPYTYMVSARLYLPLGVRTAVGCRGSVAVQAKLGRRTISTRTGFLRRDCTVRVKLAFKDRSRLKHGRLRLVVRFAGNAAVLPTRPRTLAVRVG